MKIPANFLALAYKIPNISSSNFMYQIKRALQKRGCNIAKIGFCGTLDPFARGQLILGINNHTRLLSHINKDYKTYKATLFIGCESASLDSENIIRIQETQELKVQNIQEVFGNLYGKITYKPPKFSAKHINGVRAYQLARENKEFEMKECVMDIKRCELLVYNHPFISFEITLSEGGFVRSIGNIIAKQLGVNASLCYLERKSEGNLHYFQLLDSQAYCGNTTLQDSLRAFDNQPIINDMLELEFFYNNVIQKIKLIVIDIQNALKYDTIKLTNYATQAQDGKKIYLDEKMYKEILKQDYFCKNAGEPQNKIYLADFGKHYGIVEITQSQEIRYIVNRISKC